MFKRAVPVKQWEQNLKHRDLGRKSGGKEMEIPVSNHVIKIYNSEGQYKLVFKIMKERGLLKREGGKKENKICGDTETAQKAVAEYQ